MPERLRSGFFSCRSDEGRTGSHLDSTLKLRSQAPPWSGCPRVNKAHILDKDNIGMYSRRTMATRELLNVRDTARALGVHENTIRNWESRGVLRAVHLPGSGFRRFAAQDVERLRAEMFEQLAPATEGPVVNPGRKRSGRLVFGAAND